MAPHAEDIILLPEVVKVIATIGLSLNGPGFFLLAAAWVDPGRNALQSAEQRC